MDWNRIWNNLFAPRDETLYPPCGMFSREHLIAFFLCAALIALGLFASRYVKKEHVKRVCRIFAILFTVLEGIKITYNFAYGYTWLDAWFPLAYCSLFIYGLYFAGFGNAQVEKFGYAFLAGGGIIAGSFFLIFPTTSLMLHPIYHYLCLYSMLFHSSMVYIGVFILSKGGYDLRLKGWLDYICWILPFSVAAIVMNSIWGCNMMFYHTPYNLPLEFVVKLHERSQLLYTLLIFAAYSCMYGATYGVCRLIKRMHKKSKKQMKGDR